VKKALVAAAVAAMLVAVGACGGSSSSGGVGGGSGPTAADRDRFVGTWIGNYACDFTGEFVDTMIVEAGPGDLDVLITIHQTFANPDKVNGVLTSPTVVDVPEQSMGGATGTAKLTLNGDTLEFTAAGLGITCGGTDYERS
jgi:hypothetical protein